MVPRRARARARISRWTSSKSSPPTPPPIIEAVRLAEAKLDAATVRQTRSPASPNGSGASPRQSSLAKDEHRAKTGTLTGTLRSNQGGRPGRAPYPFHCARYAKSGRAQGILSNVEGYGLNGGVGVSPARTISEVLAAEGCEWV